MKRITAKSPNSGAFSLGFQVVSERVSRIAETVCFPAEIERKFCVAKRCTALHSIVWNFVKMTTIRCNRIAETSRSWTRFRKRENHLFSNGFASWETHSKIIYFPSPNGADFRHFHGIPQNRMQYSSAVWNAKFRFISIGETYGFRVSKSASRNRLYSQCCEKAQSVKVTDC